MRFSRGLLVLIASLGLLAGAIVLRLVADGGAGGSGGGTAEAMRHLLAWPDAPAIWDLRLARVLAAIAVGTTLALGGVVLQTLLRNSLASPDILGVSSGASLGVMLSVYLSSVIGVGGAIAATAWQAGPALLGAAAALALVMLLSRRAGTIDPTALIIIGVVISVLCGALVMFLQYLMPDAGFAAARLLMGTLSDDTPRPALVLALVIAALGLIILLFVARTLDAMILDPDEAASVGVNIRAARWGLLLLTGVLTAAAVVVAGPIGFVGLIAPHAARLALGLRHAHHRLLAPVAAIFASTLLLLADTAIRLIDLGAGRMPLGILTALLGGPLLIILLRRGPSLGASA